MTYHSVGKSRRSSPESQSGVYYPTGHSSFQTGQGGRTVLPPLSSAFPTSRFPVPTHSNPYSQPRSSPGRQDYNVSSLYSQWPNNPPVHQSASSFPFYEHHDPRYQSQVTNYSSSYSSQRTTPTLPSDPHNSRRLPPLNIPPSAEREERWQASSYHTATGQVPLMNNIRSPTASYPPEYAYQPNSYSYPPAPDPRNAHHSLSHQSQVIHVAQPPPSCASQRNEPRATSPFSRNQTDVSPPTYSPPPVSPPSSHYDEPTIKKKRKRADANQLRVLNETYTRTAFPSTEERNELAKKLDMSARSVQIWFQNKRQSMRQTSRQSSSSASVASSSTQSHRHHQYSHTSDAAMLDEIASAGNYGAIHHDVPYMGMGHCGSSRASVRHASQSPPPLPSTSSHRRGRSDGEDGDLHKWSSRY